MGELLGAVNVSGEDSTCSFPQPSVSSLGAVYLVTHLSGVPRAEVMSGFT